MANIYNLDANYIFSVNKKLDQLVNKEYSILHQNEMTNLLDDLIVRLLESKKKESSDLPVDILQVR